MLFFNGVTSTMNAFECTRHVRIHISFVPLSQFVVF